MSAPRLSYSELLRDPRWQRKRLEVMQRDKFRCRECGASALTLNVHHAFYERGKKPWEYDASDLRTLCEDCHKRTEAIVADLRRQVGRLSLGEMTLMLDRMDDGVIRDLVALFSAPLRTCSICGAHRGLEPGRFVCGSCHYDPFRDSSDSLSDVA